VTVVARDAAWAEMHATALAVSSLEQARAHVARGSDVSALYVPTDGVPERLGAFPLEPGLVGAAA
jgi:thiamine biosynthesis lipoprotein ApbE